MIDTMQQARIMIVDDEPENLNVLSGMLKGHGWEVCAFPRGDYAIAAARLDPPTLILLDIRMPILNGFEVCKRLKTEEDLQDIPVIFLSALTDEEDKVKGFQVGGVDYVTKPFYASEVLARVKTHITNYHYSQHLNRLVADRTEELASAHRRLKVWDDAKTQWLNVLTHEMRTPLTGIIGTADLLMLDAPFDSETLELKDGYEQSVRRMEKLINDAMFLVGLDVESPDFEVAPVSCVRLVERAVAQLKECELYKDVPVDIQPMAERDVILADPTLLERGFAEFVRSAVCCTKEGQSIRITVHNRNDDTVEIGFHASGAIVPEHLLHTFFDVGGQGFVIRPGGDFGLSPALASRIVQLFDGKCTVANGIDDGISIRLVLPLDHSAAACVHHAVFRG